MKNIFKNMDWVDALSYLFIGLLSLGIILLLVGFFGGSTVEYSIPGIGTITEKTTVSKILNGKSSVVDLNTTDIKNLFTLHNTFKLDELYSGGNSIKNLINCAIAGFSFIMISMSIIVFFTGWMFIEWIIEKVKGTKESK